MSDNRRQPISLAFMTAYDTLGITLEFTAYNSPKGRVDTEQLMCTLKEELL